MVRLIHLSDLHFGAADARALESLHGAVAATDADAVIVTGDVTQSGKRREFEEASAYFRRFDERLIVLPGNHDAPVYDLPLRFYDPWKRFRDAFGAETDAVTEIEGAVIVGLNSARRAGPSLDWSEGRLSARQIQFAAEAIGKAPMGAARIVGLHHPVLQGPGRAGAAVVGGAQGALAAFARAGADLVLTGHVHIADAGIHAINGRALIIARAGTATSTRLRGEAASFNVIEIASEEACIDVLAFADTGYRSIKRRRFVRSADGWRVAPA